MKGGKRLGWVLGLMGAVAWAGPEGNGEAPVLLEQLQQDLGQVMLPYQGRAMDVGLSWVTLETARNCERMLDLFLADNQVGAFITAGEGSLVPREAVREVAAALKPLIAADLREKGIVENRLQAGTEIGNYFLVNIPNPPLESGGIMEEAE